MKTHYRQELVLDLQKKEEFQITTHRENPRKFTCYSILVTDTGATFRGNLVTPGSPFHGAKTMLRLNWEVFSPLVLMTPKDSQYTNAQNELDRLGLPDAIQERVSVLISQLQATQFDIERTLQGIS